MVRLFRSRWRKVGGFLYVVTRSECSHKAASFPESLGMLTSFALFHPLLTTCSAGYCSAAPMLCLLSRFPAGIAYLLMTHDMHQRKWLTEKWERSFSCEINPTWARSFRLNKQKQSLIKTCRDVMGSGLVADLQSTHIFMWSGLLLRCPHKGPI